MKKTLIAYPAFKNRETNPYQALLYAELCRRGWDVRDLDKGVFHFWRPGIVHLHWPDGFAFHRSRAKTLFRSCFLLLLLGWYRTLGSRIVWTLHNLRSHEQFHPKIEAWFWRRLYHRLDGWIALNSFSAETALGMPTLRNLPHATIPHGLYPRLGEKDEAPGAGKGKTQLLLFGKLRPYKEIPNLVEAFAGLEDDTVALTIAGQCHDDSLKEFLDQKRSELPGLSVVPRFIPDDELNTMIERADVVIIPYAGSLNSGVIFLALAYGKPVIAPSTPSFEEIAQDFGESAVRLFDPPLDTAKLAVLLQDRNAPGVASDDLKARYAWSTIAEEHDRFFKELNP